MNKSNIALITALYDTNGADLYKEIYFPVIKYAVSKSILETSDNYVYGDITGLKEIISEFFGVEIPLVVIRKSMRVMSLTSNDVIISLLDNNNYYKVEKVWDVQTKDDIDNKAECVRNGFHRLTMEFESYLDSKGLSCEKTFVDMISDLSADSIGLFDGSASMKVGEEYANLACFVQWLQIYNNELYGVVEQMVWSSVIAGFLTRNDLEFDVKTANGMAYYMDTNLVMSILDLNSIENVNYARDLLRVIKEAGAIPRIHPMTVHEIVRILQSVEISQGPFPGSSIECAFARNKLTLHDVLNLRLHLLEILDKQYGICCYPNISEELILSTIQKYKSNSKVKELHDQRFAKGDYYSEIHDVYMSDYVSLKNSKAGLPEKYAYYFVTNNLGLIDFVHSDGTAPSVISSGQVVMSLWLHSANSSKLKVPALTEMISRCFALNQTSVRRKLRMFYARYANNTLNEQDCGAMYTALINRSNNTLSKLDEFIEQDREELSQNEAMKFASDIIKTARIENEKREKREQEESQRNRELNKKIVQLTDQLTNELSSKQDLQCTISTLTSELAISEETKDKYKNEIIRRDKEKKITLELIELRSQKQVLDSEAISSVTYAKFWINIICEIFTILILLSIIVLLILHNYNVKFDIKSWFQAIGLAGLLPFVGTMAHIKNLYIIEPRVMRCEIRKRQLSSWYERHEKYNELIKIITDKENELHQVRLV